MQRHTTLHVEQSPRLKVAYPLRGWLAHLAHGGKLPARTARFRHRGILRPHRRLGRQADRTLDFFLHHRLVVHVVIEIVERRFVGTHERRILDRGEAADVVEPGHQGIAVADAAAGHWRRIALTAGCRHEAFQGVDLAACHRHTDEDYEQGQRHGQQPLAGQSLIGGGLEAVLQRLPVGAHQPPHTDQREDHHKPLDPQGMNAGRREDDKECREGIAGPLCVFMMGEHGQGNHHVAKDDDEQDIEKHR